MTCLLTSFFLHYQLETDKCKCRNEKSHILFKHFFKLIAPFSCAPCSFHNCHVYFETPLRLFNLKKCTIFHLSFILLPLPLILETYQNNFSYLLIYSINAGRSK